MTFSDKNVLVSPDTEINYVMENMQHNDHGIFIVVDEDKRILGTITDGDCRRAVLKRDGRLDTHAKDVMNTRFIAVNESFSIDHILQLMKTNGVEQIPIVDDANRLLDLISIRKLLRASQTIENPVLILAGGKGTRLRPFTNETPKPMLNVGDRPMLERLIERLVGYGFHDINISINYLGHVIKDHFGDGTKFNCRINYLEEQEELGTAAPLRLLPETNLPVLMVNGDLVTSLNFRSLIEFHMSKKDDITVGVNEYQFEIPFGVVEISEDLRVQSIREKPVISQFVNAGVYVVRPAMFKLIPEKGFFPATDLMDAAMTAGHRVGAFPIHEFWRDIGVPEQYEAIQDIVREKPGKAPL